MKHKLLAIAGILVIVFIVYLFSKEKEKIQWKSVAAAFIGQFVLAFLLVKTPLWIAVEWLSKGFTWLLNQSTAGIEFVFGGLTEGHVFFINSLLPVVFISATMGLLFHFNILQKVISFIGKWVARILKVDTVVAVNGAANMFLGQSESLFMTKPYLPTAKDSVIFATMVGGMTSISTAVVGLYVSYGAAMEWIVVSMPLTVFSTFVLTQIFMPTTYDENQLIAIDTDKGTNFVETMLNYGSAGFKGVIGISVALMVFLSFVSAVNGIFGAIIPGLTLESILGVLFSPIAILMGVPTEEVGIVAQMLATKLVTNEAVAFGMPQFNALSQNTKAAVTVALCGFGGFGSIGILLGGFSAVAPNKVKTVAKLGVTALLVATLVNVMTGALISIFI